ncbi:MAG: hypothetical protein RBJ76_06655 [Stenomitos frigidus ULC029]
MATSLIAACFDTAKNLTAVLPKLLLLVFPGKRSSVAIFLYVVTTCPTIARVNVHT